MRQFILTLFVFFVVSVPANADYLYTYHYTEWLQGGEISSDVMFEFTGISIFESTFPTNSNIYEQISNYSAIIWGDGPYEPVGLTFFAPILPNDLWFMHFAFRKDNHDIEFLQNFIIPEELIGTWESIFPLQEPGLLECTLTISAVAAPEAATIILLCSGLIGLAGLRRKFKG